MEYSKISAFIEVSKELKRFCVQRRRELVNIVCMDCEFEDHDTKQCSLDNGPDGWDFRRIIPALREVTKAGKLR